MPRATATETAERVEHLQGMILGGSRAQGYRLLKKAWAQLKDDIDETGIDRQELLSWSIQTLMAAAGQAMQQMDPDAVVASIRQRNRRPALGTTSTESMAHAFEIHHSFLKTTYWRSNQTAFG